MVVLSNPDANADLIVSHARETEAKVLVTLSAFSELAQLIQESTDVQLADLYRHRQTRDDKQRLGLRQAQTPDR